MKLRESHVLYIVMLIMGGCGLAYEYTFSRIATDLLGNSIQQWGIIIAVMMCFMGIGADLQRHIKDEDLLNKFIYSELVLSILGGCGPLILIHTYGQFTSHYIIVHYLVICLMGLLIGFEIPLITRINEQYTDALKVNIGAILKMDYVGALIGALVWIFILPRFFSMVETAFVLGLINIFGACFSFICFWKLLKNRKAIISILCGGVAILFMGLFNAEQWASYAEQYLYRDRIVLSETSRFQHIVVTETPDSSINCYINGHLQFSEKDEHIYHENLVHPAMKIVPERKNILVLGGGDGLAVREILKYDDVETVTLVDLDPAMTKLAREFKQFRRLNNDSLNNAKTTVLNTSAISPGEQVELYEANRNSMHYREEGKVANVSIINIDAAKFLEITDKQYDVIIIDFPDPNAIDLAKLYSTVFYHNLSNHLKPHGVFIQQSTSPIHAKEAFLCIGRTIEASGFAALPFHDNVPSFGEWGWWIGTKLPARSRLSKNQVRVVLSNKLKGISDFGNKTRYLTPELVESSLSFGKEQLQSSRKDITTFTSAAVFNYYLEGWQNDN